MKTPKSLSIVALSAFASLPCLFAPSPGDATEVYYTDIVELSGTQAVINRVNPDGTGMTALVTGVQHPRGMALDVLGGKMYWTELGLSVIRRANLDGTAPESVVVTGDTAGGLALDLAARKLYWTGGQHDPRVRRANFDGTGIEDLVTTGQIAPVGIALDTVHGKLYWSDLEGSGTGSIKRSNLDGSNAETILTNIDEAAGLACDVLGGKIYWPELGTKKIQRANLDGTGAEDLVTGLNNPTTISLDLVARKIYWTDSIWFGPPPRIQRSDLDGSNVEIVVSGIGFPWGIAVDAGGCLPHRATATARLDNGFVVAATVTVGGCGYTNTPLVLVQGGGGTGATATAVVSNGLVVNITITDAGVGYTSTPSIYIYSPLGLQIGLMKAVKPAFSDLLIGANYQLQLSADVNNWTNHGSVFKATSSTMPYPQYWDVDNWSQLFFRLQLSP